MILLIIKIIIIIDAVAEIVIKIEIMMTCN